jgi:UDP-N-acetylmuramoyl-L-alanyl-D-glutamate--2,6-diaminopimelate ligase
MEQYFTAKQILFEGCGTDPPRTAVINTDDEFGRKVTRISKQRGSQVFTYGWSAGDFHAKSVEISSRGTRFDLVTPQETIPLFSPLIGKVNVYNILAAAGSAFARGCPHDAIASGIGTLTRVPGRFERVDCGQPFTMVVDYAHTDDALRNLTDLAREFVAQAGQSGRVITIFGCGGDRDRAKRPLMGEAAGRGSDFVVLTSDNPRSEDPLAVMNDAKVGLQRSGTKYSMEPDRRAAIALAVREAAPGDIVLIAGKGHEKVQVSREGPFPFDDVKVARDVLAQAGYECQAAKATAGKKA